MRLVLVACLALAALSLALPSAPSYDPWAWIVWGREVAVLDLDTTGGPSWKPLPVAFTALFAPLGNLGDGIPPALWLVVARAGALLALAMAFRLARRLAGPGRAAGIGAGLVGAAALVVTPGWLRNMAHGNEAPLAIGLLLWGVERHLDDERGHAFVLGFLACLLRPEVFPFLVAHGAWLWRTEPARRRLIVPLAVALPALWLVPEWLGSGHPFAAGEQARSEPPWSLSLQAHPWLAALERAHGLAGLSLELAGLAAVVLAWRRRGAGAMQRSTATVTIGLAAVAVGWVALVAAMTQAGFSGSPRYFLPAVVLACVLAGVGVAGLVAAVPGRLPAAALGLALAVGALPWALQRAELLGSQAREASRLAKLQTDLARAVGRAGGAGAVAARGAPSVSRPFVTKLAWEAKLAIGAVERPSGRGLIFTARPRQVNSSGRVTRAGRWRVMAPPREPLAASAPGPGPSVKPAGRATRGGRLR